MMRVFSLVPVALALVVCGTAQAGTPTTQQQCFSSTLPEIPTNWMANATLPKFDPALGTLTSVDFTLATQFHGSIGVESLDQAPTVIQSTLMVTASLYTPDMMTIMGSIPTAMFSDTLDPFDGTVDFMGDSGATHTGVDASDSANGMSTDFALFTGPIGNPGTIDLPVTALGSSAASGSGNVVTQFMVTAGATVTICYTYVPNVPPVFQPPTPACGSLLMASLGVPVTFTVCAGDVDPSDVVTLSGTLPAGATTTPMLDVSGNPACVTVNWTPSNGQIGTSTFTFTAVDTHLRSATCTINVLVAECYQFLGRGGAGSNLIVGGTYFPTFVSTVRFIWPVTMVSLPSVAVPNIPTGQYQFSMQTMMHNPLVFPGNPDQWSNRMRVTILPGQVVTGQLFESLNGIHQSITTFTGPGGGQRMSFPFTIDGM